MIWWFHVSATNTVPSGVHRHDHGWFIVMSPPKPPAAAWKLPCGIVLLDAVVVRVGDVNVALRVERDVRRAAELALLDAVAADHELRAVGATVGPAGGG